MQDLNDKVTGGFLPAVEWNEVPSEIQNVIEDANITLSPLDLFQLSKAISVYASGGDFYTDSGSVNSYVLTTVGGKQHPPSYFNGMKIRFIPSLSNTGPATVNVGALGIKDLVRANGTPLVGNDMQAGVPNSFQYNTASGKFIFNGESLPDASETVKGKIEIATQAETNSGTDDTKAVTTAKLAAYLSLTLPVGSIYTNASNSTNPSTLLGFGTWVPFGQGKVMAGVDSSNTNFDGSEKTGGSEDAVLVNHTHTATVVDPGHTHSVTAQKYVGGFTDDGGAPDQRSTQQTFSTDSAVTGIGVTNSVEGVSGANANLQPYVTVYMWKRTA